MRTERVTVLEKIGFGSGDAAVNVVLSAVFIIVPKFYTDVFGIKPVHVGLLLLVPHLISAFADIAMGVFTDSHTTRWGRYRPYLFIFAVPFGLAAMLMFTTPNLSYNGKLIYAYATYILMMLIFTAIVIPYISLPGVLTADTKERLSANGYRLFFAKAAALMVTTFVPLFAARWPQEYIGRGYQASMGVMAGLATLLYFFCFFTTTERVKHTIERKPILMQLRLLFKNDQWLILAGVCFIGTVGYVIRNSVAFYYAQYFLGGKAKIISAFMTTGVVASILAMVASTWITKKFCKIQLFRWSQLVAFALSVVMYLVVKPTNVVTAFVLYFLICFIFDLQGPVFWSIISEAVDYGHVKIGKRVAGMAFGGISWCQKMGVALAGGIFGLLLVLFKYIEPIEKVPQVQNAFTLKGFSLMLTVIPGVLYLVMGLLMFKYFITDKYYNENIRKLVIHEGVKDTE